MEGKPCMCCGKEFKRAKSWPEQRVCFRCQNSLQPLHRLEQRVSPRGRRRKIELRRDSDA